MKKLLWLIAVSVMAFTGCTPSDEDIVKTAKTIGKTAGIAIELSKADGEVKQNVVDIVNGVLDVIPSADQKFADVWTPIADKKIEELVAKGKLKDTQAKIVKASVKIVFKAFDSLAKKYPVIREKTELASSVLSSFYEGLASVVTTSISPNTEQIPVDEEVLKQLKADFAAEIK